MVVVVTQVLTAEMIEAGKELVRNLDAKGAKITGALWLLEAEPRAWRLLLAFKDFDREGPKALYRKVRNALVRARSPGAQLALQDVAAVSDQHPLIRLLSMVIRTTPSGEGVRFSRNTVNGQYIEDAYIYRMAPLQKAG